MNINLIPEVIKAIAARANPQNQFTNDNEKYMALCQMEEIAKYLQIEISKSKK